LLTKVTLPLIVANVLFLIPSVAAAQQSIVSTYYLRILLALPTLHLTLGDKAAEFRTTPLLDQIRREPLCKASLL
jgi:hypothetical protein